MVQREAKLQTGEVVSYLIDVIEQMLPPRDQRPSVVEDALIKLRGGLHSILGSECCGSSVRSKKPHHAF